MLSQPSEQSLLRIGRGLAVIAVCLGLLSACGGMSRGPLTTPNTTGAGVATTAGTVAIFTIQATNKSDQPLTLSAISLLPVPGQPTPVLEHYAVIPGLDTLEDATGWPPPASGGPGPNGTWPRLSLRGYIVRPHGYVSIMVGVAGARAGVVYVMGGVTARYLLRGKPTSSVLGMVDMLCVDAVAQAAHDTCQSQHDQVLEDRAMSYVAKLTAAQ